MKGTCIFCGEYGKLTAEHIHPNWMKAYVKRKRAFTSHGARIESRESDGTVRINEYKGKLHNAGDPHSRSVKVLCGNCNNVVLGREQDKAKPILLPLVTGDWQPLSIEHQHSLAAWVTMSALVYLQVDPSLDIANAKIRKEFLNNYGALPTWTIWIGRFDGHDSGAHNLAAFDGGQAHSGNFGPKCDSMILSWTIGQMMVMAFSAPSNDNPDLRERGGAYVAQQFDLLRIWPPSAPSAIPNKIYGADWEDPVSDFKMGLGITPHRLRKVFRGSEETV